MEKAACPVNATLLDLLTIIKSDRLTLPRSRRLAEEILDLLRDVVQGRAGKAHLPALDALAEELSQSDDGPGCQRTADTVAALLGGHREVLASHIDTGNCAAGECLRLAPAPCQMACPAGIDIPTYLTLIGMGRDDEAIAVIRQDNPFPWVCGLVCTRPCEFMCVRGRIDRPVSIKFLKAFAAEKALSDRRYLNPPKAADKGKKVCIVGAGPGGMTAAYYLALKGYGVEVIEALPMAGGMMMVGIPRYRLPREVIDREVGMLESLGVVFRFNTRLGRDISLDELRTRGFDAFLFAIGAHKSFKLNISGEEDYPRVVEAIDFLRRVALGERRMPGRRVVVIGGGNVAIDAARTSLRLGSEKVTIAYRRTRHEMPADEEEVEQAEEEGVHFAFLTVPVAIQGRDGEVTALRCLRAEMVERPGSQRKSPVPLEGSDFDMLVDAVIPAIGQRIDIDCISGGCDLAWTRRNTIEVNLTTMETSEPGIFAVGDAVTGPATVVEAIGGGKRAAEAIDRYLLGIPQPKKPPGTGAPRPLRPDRGSGQHQDDPAPARDAAAQHRTAPHHLPAGRTGLLGEHDPRGGPPLPALRYLPALRALRGGLPRQDANRCPATGILQFRPPGGNRFPAHRGALHPLRRLRVQLPDRSDAHRGPQRGADSFHLRHDPQPPAPGNLPAVRGAARSGTLSGVHSQADRSPSALGARPEALRCLRPARQGGAERGYDAGLKRIFESAAAHSKSGNFQSVQFQQPAIANRQFIKELP